MFTSKAPAYFGLVAAVAAGVLLSGVYKSTSSAVAPSLEKSTPAIEPSPPVETKPAQAAIWEPQTLNIGSQRIKVNLPWFGENAKCIMPGPTDDEVGFCQPTSSNGSTSIWQIRIVTQRDRYVPLSWFDNATQALRSLPADALVRQLGNEANVATKAGFTDAALLPPAQLPGAVAIQGSASAPPSFQATVRQSCVYAFLLAGNRPATLLFCAANEQDALSGAQKIASSLLKLNPSTEYKRGSTQAVEHGFYLKRLKAAGGPSEAPQLVSSEQAYEESAANECQKYSVISQERFQCFEGAAARRLASL